MSLCTKLQNCSSVLLGFLHEQYAWDRGTAMLLKTSTLNVAQSTCLSEHVSPKNLNFPMSDPISENGPATSTGCVSQ